MIEISSAEARRLALASLGFGVKRPNRVGRTHVRATAARLGALQIDSVNVLARAHYLPIYSRYGAYPTTLLDDLAHGKRDLFEYWAHAACFVPIERYPLLRWRMSGQVEAWSSIGEKHQQFVNAVYQEVAERGPLAAGEITMGGRKTGPWWGWSDAKRAVELLYRQGRVAIAGRRNFERLYDLTERVIPRDVLDVAPIGEHEAKKELLVLATRAMGVGTAPDIARYFHVESWWDRTTPAGRRPAVKLESYFDELVEEGRLERVRVEGWKRPAFVVPDVRLPRSIDVRAIVSPFDPVLWERAWTKAVFDFDYQIEIYVPAPKRVYGYYVLPFLLGDRFAGRLDLKADRKRSTLLVHAAYVEPGRSVNEVADAAAGELRSLQDWLSLDSLSVGRRGNLSATLRRAASIK
jgi:hypothetical protein